MSGSNYFNTPLRMKELIGELPVGSKQGSSSEYYAAKARIAAIFMERRSGMSRLTIEEMLCRGMGIKTLGKKRAETVLNLGPEFILDNNQCNLIMKENKAYFDLLEKIVKPQ